MRDAQIKDSSEKGYLEAEVDAYLWKLNNPFWYDTTKKVFGYSYL